VPSETVAAESFHFKPFLVKFPRFLFAVRKLAKLANAFHPPATHCRTSTRRKAAGRMKLK
jgi:hypothetical protein